LEFGRNHLAVALILGRAGFRFGVFGDIAATMERSSQQKTRGFYPVRILFQHCRRRVWMYTLWLLAYMATVLFYGMGTEAQPRQMLPFLVPVAVVLAQMIYPTLFAWAAISLLSVGYAGVGIYYLIRGIAHKQWRYDLQGLVFGLVFVSVYVVICIGLILSRPRPISVSSAAESRG
jgi:hypothetical protein